MKEQVPTRDLRPEPPCQPATSLLTVRIMLSQVVRMRARSPGAAMDALCEHLVTTLHESHGPVMSTAGKDVSDRAHREKAHGFRTSLPPCLFPARAPTILCRPATFLLRRLHACAHMLPPPSRLHLFAVRDAHRLYDVTWHHSSNSSTLDGPHPQGGLHPHWTPHPHDGAWWPPVELPAARRRTAAQQAFSQTLSVPVPPPHRPYLSNPHSALVLDLQFRLLRTTGESFSYVSGRSQSDGGMPWFGVGRQIGGFEADKKRVGVSYRPTTSGALLGVRAASPSSHAGGAASPSRGGSGSASPRVERALSFGSERSRRGGGRSSPRPSKRVSL